MAKVIAQLAKPTRVPLRYPCTICYNFKHRAFDYPKKAKVQNMLWTKQTTTTIVVTKNPKPNNVLVNVIVIVTTCS